MKAVALVEAADHVCCRYRLRAFEPALRAAGWQIEVRPLARRWWQRIKQWADLDPADVVVLQRKLLGGWEIGWLRRRAGAVIYDFDDAVLFRDSYSKRGPISRKRLRRFRATVQAADAVIAGNPFLARWAANARSWAAAEGRAVPAADGTAAVRVVPTCVDPGRYPLARHWRAGRGVELVWIGSASTLQGLGRARALLEAIGRQVPGMRLRVICDVFPAFDHLDVVARPWSEATEAEELAAGDIGVSWVPDDPWSRGKCGLKLLQYMAAGLPVVTNPVGVHREIVRAGRTGELPETTEAWIEAIRRLAHDPERRRMLGTEGRRRVEREYSVQRWAPAIVEILAGVGRPTRACPAPVPGGAAAARPHPGA